MFLILQIVNYCCSLDFEKKLVVAYNGFAYKTCVRVLYISLNGDKKKYHACLGQNLSKCPGVLSWILFKKKNVCKVTIQAFCYFDTRIFATSLVMTMIDVMLGKLSIIKKC